MQMTYLGFRSKSREPSPLTFTMPPMRLSSGTTTPGGMKENEYQSRVPMSIQEAPLLVTPMLTSLDLVAAKACMEAGGAPQPTVNENRTKSSEQNLQRCKRMTTPLPLDVNWASRPKGLSAGRDRNTMWHSIKGQSGTVHPFDYLINLSVYGGLPPKQWPERPPMHITHQVCFRKGDQGRSG